MIDPQALCQIEITAPDMEHSLAFYEQVFGWSAVPVDIQGYVVLNVPDGCPFGVSLIRSNAQHAASHSVNVLYFRVADAEGVVERAKVFGSVVRLGPKSLPGYGRIYQIIAPEGQVYGLFQGG